MIKSATLKSVMLDPQLCPAPDTTNNWTALSWRVFELLASPEWVLPPILLVIGLPWLIPSLRRKRSFSKVGVAFLALYLIVISPQAAAIGNRLLTGFLPSDLGNSVDAVVVLGRGAELRSQRVDVVANLWVQQRAPLIFASGWGDALEINAMLSAQGVPATALDGEPCSRTTEENARFTAAQLKPRGVKQILLVTDPPHLLRSLLTFRSLGFIVTPHSSPLPTYLDNKKKALLVFREYLGIASYGIRGRFLPRKAADALATVTGSSTS